MNWIRDLLGLGSKQTRKTYVPPKKNASSSTAATMNQGDYHSGPAGYSANTAYLDTPYGTGFDEDAEWNEGDWR